MKTNYIFFTFFCALWIMATSARSHAAQGNPVPLPPAEQNVPSETAESWITAAPENDIWR